jgi:hypothetical protein
MQTTLAPALALQQFIAHAEAAGTPGLEDFKRVMPVATAIALFADPLDPTHQSIGDYISDRTEEALKEPLRPGEEPEPDFTKAVETENGCYLIGLAVGIIVGAQLGGK